MMLIFPGKVQISFLLLNQWGGDPSAAREGGIYPQIFGAFVRDALNKVKLKEDVFHYRRWYLVCAFESLNV